MLDYIINNLDGICKLFGPEEITNLKILDLIQLRSELRPIYTFTTLLELARERFNTTADIQLAKICYFTTNCGLIEKGKNHQHVSSISIRDLNDPKLRLIVSEIDFISSFDQIIEETCGKLGFDTKVIKEAFEIMMDYYEPSNDEIYDYPRKKNLRDTFLRHSLSSDSYILLAEFIEILQVLPASKAGAGRIFARMRDIHDFLQTRMSPQTLKSNLILSFYALEKNYDNSDEKEIIYDEE
ncbi:hypothetical protein M9Y10_028599 [Tritrichomonas musculus]|uniref:HAT C-terminal dimerisation domain-containing protein n=1 Tax=Tritrichomonas musculus TaxID=1915356 RepID=A0ABR2KKP1_9EUKA